MISFFYLSLVPVVLARPSIIPRTYSVAGVATKELHPDLLKDWYSKWDSTKTSIETPANPAGVYSCVGPNMDAFPKKDKWLSFQQLWQINEPIITESNGGETYNEILKETIEEVSEESKVDARIILALIMQESTGKLAIHCTNGDDCGILQHSGSRQFNPNNAKQSIKNMIEDGIYGTGVTQDKPYGCPGFLTYFNGKYEDLYWLGTEQFWRGNPFAAAHVYNVGSITNADLTKGPSGSNYYANDLLSRLQGWNGWQGGCLKSAQCPGLGFSGRKC